MHRFFVLLLLLLEHSYVINKRQNFWVNFIEATCQNYIEDELFVVLRLAPNESLTAFDRIYLLRVFNVLYIWINF